MDSSKYLTAYYRMRWFTVQKSDTTSTGKHCLSFHIVVRHIIDYYDNMQVFVTVFVYNAGPAFLLRCLPTARSLHLVATMVSIVVLPKWIDRRSTTARTRLQFCDEMLQLHTKKRMDVFALFVEVVISTFVCRQKRFLTVFPPQLHLLGSRKANSSNWR